MELGAFTVFLYMIKAREFLWELVEDVTGARLTISYGRVGGVKADLPTGFDAQGRRRPSRETREVLEEVHTLLTGNRIFMDRMVGVGALSREETIAYAITGPLLRAVGVPLRRAAGAARTGRTTGSSSRSRLGKNGDNFDRYLVRMAEMEQSMRIAEQALAQHARRPDQRGLRGAADRSRRLRRPGQAGQDRGPAADRRIRLSPNLAGPGRGAPRGASTPPTSAWCCRRRRPPTAPSRA